MPTSAATPATINGRTVQVNPGETLLDAALRDGLDFPYSCRVGGCGTCACQITQGSVRELRPSGRVLTKAQREAGTVLACQTVPTSPVAVQVELAQAVAERAAQRTAAPPPTRQDAGWFDHLKFSLFHVVGLVAVGFLTAGGPAIAWGTAGLVAFYVLGDMLLGHDTDTPHFAAPRVLTWQLWGALPLTALLVFVSVWTMSSGDPLGFGASVQQLTGRDVLASREATTAGQHVAGWFATSLLIGLLGTIPAHELTHRTWDSASMAVGRALLAFSFDAGFAVEHVYGHHRYVSTVEDPATAPRGRNVYAHIVLSTVQGNLSAWRLERARLQGSDLPVWSHHNVVLTGHAMSAVLMGVAWWMGGPVAVAYFAACALGGKSLLEIVNYMEHYGIVRDPADPVQPRHSWNTTTRISSWSMFYLTRHSHHHADGTVPFQDLRPMAEAPTMIGGYLTTVLVALCPPLWHRLMTPKVLEWDATYASARELELAAAANARSGLPALMQHTPPYPTGATRA